MREITRKGLLLGGAVLVGAARAARARAAQASAATAELKTVFASDLVINGPTTSPSGRLFTCAQPQGTSHGPQVVELTDGAARPFPDAAWNGWRDGQDGAHAFVGVNSLRVGPDGGLWAVDRGGPGIGAPLAPHGPKLVRIDLRTNAVSRVYDLAEATNAGSFVDDVRFNGRHAYLTDAGRPGLIVLDLETGAVRRALDGAPSVTARRPLVAEGKPLRNPKGEPVVIHADQLEVSPDGRWLYFQPCCGPMSKIETRWLDSDALSPAELGTRVVPFADTPSTGSTAIDATGNIYLSDTDRSRILKIDPDGLISTLIADSRLAWVDAMWIDEAGNLLMPAAQLSRTPGLNGGVDAVEPPIRLYALAIGAQPVRR